MRVHSAVLALLLLCSTTAFADSIDRVSPQSFFAGNPEQFLTLFGSGLAGSESTVVVYDGPAGNFAVDASNVSSTQLDVWVPVLVTLVPGRYSVTVLATDIGGVTRQIGPAFIDVIEQVIQAPPLLGIPESVVAEATSSAGANVSFSATGVSQGGTGLVVSCDHVSGSLFPLGSTTVTCTATDSFGTTTGTFPVVVTDTVKPTLTLPGPIVSSDAVVSWTATATDAIDGPLVVHCSPASGSTFPFGTTVVQCFAVDSDANETTGSFTVTVTGGAPVLTLPADITAEATSPSGAVVTYTATADTGTISCSPASGSTFPLGTTTVQCTATNSDGTTTGSFHVTVQDTTPPDILKLTADPSTLWPPDHKMVVVTVSAVVFDAADPNPLVHIISVTSNQPVNGTGDGDTAPDWEITGPMTVKLRSERSANLDRKYTITVEVTDASGNISHSSLEVKVTQSSKGRAVR